MKYYTSLNQLLTDYNQNKVNHLNSKVDDDTFINELEISKKIDYPNYNRFMETSKQNGNMYIVYEQYDNTMNLIEFAFNTRLTLFIAYSIAKQLAKTIRYLHTIGIVHGNICPENVIITTVKRKVKLDKFNKYEQYNVYYVKLIGLNQSQEFDFEWQESDNERDSEDIYRKSWVKARSGNLFFTAPEVFFDSFYTKKADVYSYGVILFWLLTGCYPYDPLTEEGVRRWRNGTISNLEKLSAIGQSKKNSNSAKTLKNLLQLVMHCLQFDEQERCELINILGSPESAKCETNFYTKKIKPSGKRKNKQKHMIMSNAATVVAESSNPNIMDQVYTEDDLMDEEQKRKQELDKMFMAYTDSILTWYNEWFDEVERICINDDRIAPLIFFLNRLNEKYIKQLLYIKFSNRLCKIIYIFICERYYNKIRMLEAGRIFQDMDMSGKGYLDEDDIYYFLRRYQDEDTARQTVRTLFNNIDINHNKSIEWSEFKLCSMDLAFDMVYNKLQRIYRLINVDDNKTVNIDDIVYTLHEGSQEEIKWFKVQITELEDNEMNIEKGEYKEMIKQIIIDLKNYTFMMNNKINIKEVKPNHK